MSARNLTLLLSALSAPVRVLGGGSCTVVPMREAYSDYIVAHVSTGRKRRYWCQVNCPVSDTVSDGHASAALLW